MKGPHTWAAHSGALQRSYAVATHAVTKTFRGVARLVVASVALATMLAPATPAAAASVNNVSWNSFQYPTVTAVRTGQFCVSVDPTTNTCTRWIYKDATYACTVPLPDGDFIYVNIEHNAVDPAAVVFVLISGPDVTWWKNLNVPDAGGISWDIWTQDSRKSDAVAVWASMLQTGRPLTFSKAKFLGTHTAIYALSQLPEQIHAGDRVTFTWSSDSSPNCYSPVTGAQPSALSTTGATLTWATEQPMDSQVEYGPTTAYGSTSALDSTLAATHSVNLTGLQPGATYHYRVKSQDPAGNRASMGDLTFTMPGSATNVALGKPSTQSSTAAFSCNPAASKAVDGNTDGVFADCSVTHTNFEAQPWWQVDLQGIYAVNRIDVWNRLDCCSTRLSNFIVAVSIDGLAWTTVYTQPGAAGTVASIPVSTKARFVKVQLLGTDYLHLAEVQVWGAP